MFLFRLVFFAVLLYFGQKLVKKIYLTYKILTKIPSSENSKNYKNKQEDPNTFTAEYKVKDDY